jgi:hypothetical protein
MGALKAWWSLEALYYQCEVLFLGTLLVFFMLACVVKLKCKPRIDHEKVQLAMEQLNRYTDTR